MNVAYKVRKNLAIRLAVMQQSLLNGFSLPEIEAIAGNVALMTRALPSQPLVTYARMLIERSTTPNEFALNGEQLLLDRVSSLPFKVLFDVGANIGTWATYAAKTFPRADLHAFEIVPSTFAQLRSALKNDARIFLNCFGLSDATGSIAINTYKSHYISSMFALDATEEFTGQIQCEVESGEKYVRDHGIKQIDFLKVDVEGAEGKVLCGFQTLLAHNSVRLIQFEYNRGALLGDFLLKQAYGYFKPLGYQLGKLTPGGVFFHNYELTHEDFVGPNYVAIRHDDDELRNLISV